MFSPNFLVRTSIVKHPPASGRDPHSSLTIRRIGRKHKRLERQNSPIEPERPCGVTIDTPAPRCEAPGGPREGPSRMDRGAPAEKLAWLIIPVAATLVAAALSLPLQPYAGE